MRFSDTEVRRVLDSRILEGDRICLFGSKSFPKVIQEDWENRRIFVSDFVDSETSQVLLYGALEDVPDAYLFLKEVSVPASHNCRITVISFSRLWHSWFKPKSKSKEISNWIPPEEIVNLLELSGLEVVSSRKFILLPIYIPFVSRFLNRWLAPLPLFRWFTAIDVICARKQRQNLKAESLSIIIAARNEYGNISPLIDRIPKLANHQEVIFVEGGSQDATWEVIQEEVASQRRRQDFVVSAYKQDGKGKGDAVRKGFENSSGEILMILDADISVEPEELHKFTEALLDDSCEFANGTRLVYPLEDDAMRTLNIIGNRIFGLLFSFLLGQHLADTLCGTKVLWKKDYDKIAANRSYFGDFDPFGDFDLLFGAAHLNLRIRDIPIHYKSRTYGATNISRFRQGLLLLRMTWIAARRLKFV